MSTENEIRDAIWQLSFAFKSSVKREIRAHGLRLNSMHVRILHLIQGSAECTATELVNTTQRDKAQITRILKELSDMSLIERGAHPVDRRSRVITLSNRGALLMKRTQQMEADVTERLLSNISEHEKKRFIELSEKMLSNLNNEQN